MKFRATIEQQMEITKLANKGHADALIAFGADCHREGLATGTITGAIGALIGVGLTICIGRIVERRRIQNTAKQKEEG